MNFRHNKISQLRLSNTHKVCRNFLSTKPERRTMKSLTERITFVSYSLADLASTNNPWTALESWGWYLMWKPKKSRTWPSSTKKNWHKDSQEGKSHKKVLPEPESTHPILFKRLQAQAKSINFLTTKDQNRLLIYSTLSWLHNPTNPKRQLRKTLHNFGHPTRLYFGRSSGRKEVWRTWTWNQPPLIGVAKLLSKSKNRSDKRSAKNLTQPMSEFMEIKIYHLKSTKKSSLKWRNLLNPKTERYQVWGLNFRGTNQLLGIWPSQESQVQEKISKKTGLAANHQYPITNWCNSSFRKIARRGMAG